MCYFGATPFVKQGVGTEFQCLCWGVGVYRNESTAFIVVLVSKAIIRNTKAIVLASRTNKRASQEIREVIKFSKPHFQLANNPNIPYGKFIVSHFGNIDVLTKFEPLKMQIFLFIKRTFIKLKPKKGNG